MVEVEEDALERARQQLAAANVEVAALIASGGPAVERAVRAVALNEGDLARAVIGLARALRYMEQHVSRGMLRSP